MKFGILALVYWRGFLLVVLMFLPIGLKVEGKLCLLVGGGAIAAHKCQALLTHGARVRVVAQAFNNDPVWSQDPVCSQNRVEKIQATYEAKYLDGVSLVIAATNDTHANRLVAEDSHAANLFVLRADSPDECDWIMPATLRRGAFTISFGTDGLFPSLAARVKRDSSTIFGEDLARLCEDARRLRQSAQQTESGQQLHKSSLSSLADSLDEFWFLQGVRHHCENGSKGKVYLVGAGPGDLGLITVKGAECLRSATVVIHDALANNELLDMYCNGALRVDVSKRKGMCLHMQPEINQMLIDWACKGHTVVRLKGGDPMTFGRGGEEARALFGAGIAFEIVPGVSSLSSVPAYAGIPVTDREFGAASAGFYSLHHRSGTGLSDEEWQKMAHGPETLVLFMGMTMLATAAEKLRQYGRKGDTPVALITQGTLPGQREVVATLDTIVESCERQKLPGPGLIVIGNVINAKRRMEWFHPQEQAHDLTQMAEAASKDKSPIEIVLIRSAEIEDQYQGRYIGSTDAALSAEGMRRAAALAELAELQEPGLVFASPLLRVRQTVEAARLNDNCAWLDNLREIGYGDWENLTFSEIAASDPANFNRWAKLDGSFAFPGGDSLDSFQQRISHAAETILTQARANQKDKVFIFAPDVVLRFLIVHWLGLPMHALFSIDVACASVSTVRMNGGRGTLTRLNNTEHLRNL